MPAFYGIYAMYIYRWGLGPNKIYTAPKPFALHMTDHPLQLTSCNLSDSQTSFSHTSVSCLAFVSHFAFYCAKLKAYFMADWIFLHKQNLCIYNIHTTRGSSKKKKTKKIGKRRDKLFDEIKKKRRRECRARAESKSL